MTERKFEARRDWWVWPSIAFTVAVALIAVVSSVSDERMRSLAAVVSIYAAWRVARILLMSYRLRGRELHIVRWPFRQKYSLDNIVRVRAINRLETPPSPGTFMRRRNEALSYHVLALHMLDGPAREVYISPKDRDGFLQQLQFLAPHIAVDKGAPA